MRSQSWASLQQHFEKEIKNSHLKELLNDQERNSKLIFSHKDFILDLTHERLNQNTLSEFQKLSDNLNLTQRVQQMFQGDKINVTEQRAVLHYALRAKKDQKIDFEGKNVVPDVHEILERIKNFSNKIRSGELKGFTGKNITDVLVIGIGGSYLSIEFVHESLRNNKQCAKASEGRKIKFLANVDPIDFARATEGLNTESTIIVINSKTFTTAETILNAKTAKQWLLQGFREKGIKLENQEDENKVCNIHISAVSTNLKATGEFGISPSQVFGFWDWVGGRYSVWSAIGILPLSLQYGFEILEQFLDGGNDIDQIVLNKNITENLPLLLALTGFYNTTICQYSSRAILPYCQALCKFVPHIQQLDMESNGKRVDLQGKTLEYECTGVNFGEPGTNGQHSFYQLLHQGRTIPCEFIGFIKSQNPVFLQQEEKIPNHDELMSNFFSQPDALAYGKNEQELKQEKVVDQLIPHKIFPGNRPSLSLLISELTPFTCGQLLSLYEHRTIIEGFIWDVNSFDQMGVELGKILAKNVRNCLVDHSQQNQPNLQKYGFNSATQSLLEAYISKK